MSFFGRAMDNVRSGVSNFFQNPIENDKVLWTKAKPHLHSAAQFYGQTDLPGNWVAKGIDHVMSGGVKDGRHAQALYDLPDEAARHRRATRALEAHPRQITTPFNHFLFTP